MGGLALPKGWVWVNDFCDPRFLMSPTTLEKNIIRELAENKFLSRCFNLGDSELLLHSSYLLAKSQASPAKLFVQMS